MKEIREKGRKKEKKKRKDIFAQSKKKNLN